MRNVTIKNSGLLLSFVMQLFLTTAYASDNFVKISLPKGVSVEVPKNWVVISKDQRITLDTMVESGLDLAGIDQENSDLPFAANYYNNGKTIGIINNRYYSDLELTQYDAQQATNQDIKELDSALKENMVKSMSAFGMSILSWEGTKKTTVNGITAFVTEYHRKALKGTGAFRVRLVRVFAGKRSFTLTVSYSENEAFFLKTITDRIISSLKLAGIQKVQIESNTGSIFNDIMSKKYGENWSWGGIILAIIIFWGIALTPPLLIRFLFVRRPIGKGWAIGTTVIFWFISFIFFDVVFGYDSKGSILPYFLIAWASYTILRKGYKKVIGNAETEIRGH
jgi:hypothetical protein